MSTKTAKVIANLGERLRNGEWEAEASLPSVSLLSGQYGVSSGTVALALRSLEREGLVKVVPRQGIFSTVKAQDANGVVNKSPTIGIYGRYSTRRDSSYMSRLTDGILEAAHGLAGAVLMLPKSAGETLNRQYCERQGVKGLIVLGGNYLPQASQLREEGFPMITPNQPVGGTALNYVSIDHSCSIHTMTEHFVAAGHRRIAVLTYETSTSGLYEALKLNFIHALCEADIYYNPNPYWRQVVWPLDHSMELREKERALFSAVDELLALPEPPTAFFCRGIFAKPLLKYLKEKGLRVPSDVSVIGSAYDDEESALTSGFVIRHEEVGRRLVMGLYKIIRNPFHSVQELVPLPFVDKGTVASPSAQKAC